MDTGKMQAKLEDLERFSGGGVTSVAGKTGDVPLAKSDVGLGSVDNTADTAKPVSTAQAAADALKLSKAGDTLTGDLTLAGGGNYRTFANATDDARIILGVGSGNEQNVGMANSANNYIGVSANGIDLIGTVTVGTPISLAAIYYGDLIVDWGGAMTLDMAALGSTPPYTVITASTTGGVVYLTSGPTLAGWLIVENLGPSPFDVSADPADPNGATLKNDPVTIASGDVAQFMLRNTDVGLEWRKIA